MGLLFCFASFFWARYSASSLRLILGILEGLARLFAAVQVFVGSCCGFPSRALVSMILQLVVFLCKFKRILLLGIVFGSWWIGCSVRIKKGKKIEFYSTTPSKSSPAQNAVHCFSSTASESWNLLQQLLLQAFREPTGFLLHDLRHLYPWHLE